MKEAMDHINELSEENDTFKIYIQNYETKVLDLE